MWKQRFIFFALGAMVTLGGVLAAGTLFDPEQGSAPGTYRLFAEFSDAGTLRPGSRVAMAGVTIGEVASVELDPDSYRARVAMDIHDDVDELAIDSTAVILTAGLVGPHYIDISPGGHPDSLSENDYIEDTQSAISIETLILRRITGRGR